MDLAACGPGCSPFRRNVAKKDGPKCRPRPVLGARKEADEQAAFGDALALTPES
jgi:hypothetical protein